MRPSASPTAARGLPSTRPAVEPTRSTFSTRSWRSRPAAPRRPVPFTGLVTPEQVAVDSVGDVYVADGVLGLAGELIRQPLAGPPRTWPPRRETPRPPSPGNGLGLRRRPARSRVTSRHRTPVALAQSPHPLSTTATTEVISGLTNGSSYTFKVAAVNAGGTGGQSGASNAVIVGAPSAPVLQSAVPGNGSAKVQWWPPSGNGAAISGYVITPYLGATAQPAQTFATAANSDTVVGLTNGSSYTFRIAAKNSFGTGARPRPRRRSWWVRRRRRCCSRPRRATPRPRCQVVAAVGATGRRSAGM